MEEIIKQFKESCCSTCKAEHCNKGIVISKYNNMESVKCADYVKDESKIKGYVKPLEKTAEEERALMPKLWCRK